MSFWESDSDDDEENDAMEDRVPWLQETVISDDENDCYDNNEVPREYRCAITLDVMVIPVRLKESTTSARYEKTAVEHWLARRPNRDPMTNAEYSKPLCAEIDLDLRDRIENWRASLGLPKKRRSPNFGRLSADGAVSRCVDRITNGKLNEAEDAARALSQLCEFDDRCRVAARHRGAHDVLIAVLRRRDLIPESMKAWSARCLANLARNGDNRFLIARSGGVKPLGQLVESANHDSTREAGALALARMARTYKIWTVQAAKPLVTILERHSTGSSAKFAAASAIWALSCGSDATKRDVVNAGAVSTLVHILRTSSSACCAPPSFWGGAPNSIDLSHLQSTISNEYLPTDSSESSWTTDSSASTHSSSDHRLVQVAGWALANLATSHDRWVRRIVQTQLRLRWFPFIEPSRPIVKRHVQRLVDRRTAIVS